MTIRSKGEKLAQRLSQILARLHQGDSFDKHDLARDFQVDIRTIERDLGERLHGYVERDQKGHWQLTHAARSSVPVKYLQSYARMAGTEHLFPDSSLRYLLQQLEVSESRPVTRVQPVSHEDLGGGETFTLLQDAIEHQYSCSFIYKGTHRDVHPYRLIHKNGIWYVAAEESDRLKNFSVGRLENLRVDRDRQFAPNSSHHEYINQKDDVWFTTETTEVLLRVAPEIAQYFTRRPLLPRQQQRTDSDGSLLVTTHINHIDQLLPVVRYWLPHVRVVQPKEWHEALVTGLKLALVQWAS